MRCKSCDPILSWLFVDVASPALTRCCCRKYCQRRQGFYELNEGITQLRGEVLGNLEKDRSIERPFQIGHWLIHQIELSGIDALLAGHFQSEFAALQSERRFAEPI